MHSQKRTGRILININASDSFESFQHEKKKKKKQQLAY